MNPLPLPERIAEQLPGETPRLDAQVLLAHILRRDRSWVLAHPEATLTPEQENALQTDLRRLQAGTPLPYVLGHWEFFGLDFEVTPDVLIPRPETELLIENALEWVRTHPEPVYRFIDVGSGSGCIPVSLAVHVPRAEILATDISPAALAVARRNAERHGVQDRITFVECDLLPATIDGGRWTVDATVDGPPSTVQLVTANLPYIPSETVKGLQIARHEPLLALDGGPDGLVLIRRLLALLSPQMDTGQLVLLEIEASLGPAAQALAEAAFPAAIVRIQKDLAGHDRLVIIET